MSAEADQRKILLIAGIGLLSKANNTANDETWMIVHCFCFFISLSVA
jgi:hypothetical protein